MIRAVDLFAGAGGTTEGATLAGARVVAAINHWPVAVQTHAANHPMTEHYCQDATLFDPRRLPPFHLLTASPECRGHARARGAEAPHHDASRSTAWCVVNVAEVTRPEYLLIENVPEFLTWPLYPAWEMALRMLGYDLRVSTLDAAAFGVPQNRVRIYIAGVQRGAGRVRREAPAFVAPDVAPVPASSFLDWSAGDWSRVRRPGRSAKTLARIKASRALFGDRFLVPYYGSATHGRSVERPIGSLTTRARYALVDGDRMRMLTIAEQRAAMGFRADYRLFGSVAEQVHQLGNGVCPPVARALVRQLCGEGAVS